MNSALLVWSSHESFVFGKNWISVYDTRVKTVTLLMNCNVIQIFPATTIYYLQSFPFKLFGILSVCNFLVLYYIYRKFREKIGLSQINCSASLNLQVSSEEEFISIHTFELSTILASSWITEQELIVFNFFR